MSDRPLALIFAVPAMVACCVGLPLLLGWLMSVGLFAWLAGSAFVVIVVVVIAAVVVYVLHRDRRKRRHLGALQEQAVVNPAADDVPPSAPHHDHQS